MTFDLLPSNDVKQQVQTNPLARNEILCKLRIIRETETERVTTCETTTQWLKVYGAGPDRRCFNVRVHMFIRIGGVAHAPQYDLVARYSNIVAVEFFKGLLEQLR